MSNSKKAVALRYKQGTDQAPKVVAKGIDSIARRIIEIAEEENIPVVKSEKAVEEFYGLDLDEEIPSDLYELAAEIIAFVYKLDKEFS